MAKAKFEKGDRVICIEQFGGAELVGKTGTICRVQNAHYGVCFDSKVKQLHDLDGHCDNGHGWWFYRFDDIDYLAKISK